MEDVTVASYSSYGGEKGSPQKCTLPFSKQIASLLQLAIIMVTNLNVTRACNSACKQVRCLLRHSRQRYLRLCSIFSSGKYPANKQVFQQVITPWKVFDRYMKLVLLCRFFFIGSKLKGILFWQGQGGEKERERWVKGNSGTRAYP